MDKFHIESENMMQFIAGSPSCFHAVQSAAKLLEQRGFERLYENQSWKLEPGKSCYVTRNGSSLIAFRLPRQPFGGFQLICSHTDSPCFKIKENPEMEADKKYTKLNVEKYGGMLMAPWFDRPLSVAGRVLVQEGEKIRPVLVNIERDLLLIPSLAIHMNRSANDGYAYNAQTDMCPVYGDAEAMGSFDELIAENAGVKKEQVLGADLFLYNRQPGVFWGRDNEFVASPRLDDLQCMYASLQGFLEADEVKNGAVFCAFDNEETGSMSKQGAASTFLVDTLKRINAALGGTPEDYLRLVADSFMISADNAHALHPNHAQAADPVNRPQMNRGIVIKHHAGQKYTTDAVSAAAFRHLCEKSGIPCQTFTNRSDQAGGSTLGNISSAQVSVRCVDVGLAQLAMHSPYESAGAKDTLYMKQMAEQFYRSRITADGDELMIEI